MSQSTRPTQIIVRDPSDTRAALTRPELETRGMNALCKDKEFLVGVMGWERRQQALAIVRVVLAAVLD